MAQNYQQPEYELTYFNGRGLAETSRLIFAYAGTPYVDKRFPLDVIDFSKRQFKRDEFDEAKAGGALDLSLGKVPFLKTGGVTLSQSKAIERFLAKRLGCMGTTDLETALIDAFCEHIRDAKTEYQPYRQLEGEAKQKGLDKFFEEKLPTKLKALEKTLGPADKWLIGTSASLADIALFSLVEFFDDTPKIMSILESTPKLLVSYQNFSALPKIKEWVEDRPLTPF